MIELHIDIENFPLEKALYSASLAHVKCVGFLFSDSSLSGKKVTEIKNYIKELALIYDIEVFLGYKIAYVPPALIGEQANRQREKNFDFICVHGENIYDNIPHGTNLAALSADVDILLSPGIVDDNLLEYAKEKKTYLEFNLNPLYASGNTLLANNCCDEISLIWGNTIKSEKDFIYSLLRKQAVLACGKNFNQPENDLIKKLNQDTFTFTQNIIRKSR